MTSNLNWLNSFRNRKNFVPLLATLFILVAIPITVVSVLSQRDQRSKAAGCSTNPTTSLSPTNQNGIVGDTTTYNFSVTNNDDTTCTSSSYSLSNSLPNGWTGSFSQPSVTLAPGASTNQTLTINSAAGKCTAEANMDSEERALLVLINNFRATYGRGALVPSFVLAKAAQWKSNDMAAKSYVANDDPNPARTWYQATIDCGYTYATGRGQSVVGKLTSWTAQDAFNEFIKDGNNQLDMTYLYSVIGIGREYGPLGWYWTIIYGSYNDGWPTPTPTDTVRATATNTSLSTATSTASSSYTIIGDTDADNCPDSKEQGADWHTGGQRDVNNPWDFYDVPTPTLTPTATSGKRNRVVSLADVISILAYVGTVQGNTTPNANGVRYDSDLNANGIADGKEYDRTASVDPTQPWKSGSPNGAVSIADSIVALAQVGANCN